MPRAEIVTGPAGPANAEQPRFRRLRESFANPTARTAGTAGRPAASPRPTVGTEFKAVGIDLTERREAESERAAIERKMQDAQRLEAARRARRRRRPRLQQPAGGRTRCTRNSP